MPLLNRIKDNLAPLFAVYENRIFVENITPEYLAGKGAKAVIFDHDGVLSPSLANCPDTTGEKLLLATVKSFDEDTVFVLSNTRRRKKERTKLFQGSFPGVTYLVAKAKPDPEGLFTAAHISGVDTSSIAVVDDGLLTGVLMAVEMGAIPVYAIRKSLDETIEAKLTRLVTTWPQIALLKVVQFLFGR